jgi:anthranilate synthase component II
MKLLVLDNYDSFTYNLVHLIRGLGVDHEVHRNDRIAPADTDRFDAIVLSPGPGVPSEAGIMPELIRRHAPDKPIFGICLGHQALAEYMGCRLRNMTKVYHGVSTPVHAAGASPLLEGLPDPFEAGRYHSWDVMEESLTPEVRVTARDEQGTIMALEHQHLPLYGVQFHPESIMTPEGPRIMRNFIEIAKRVTG